MLFNKDDLKKHDDIERMLSHSDRCIKYISEDIDRDLSVAMGDLQPGWSYHFDTGTKWSLHDIVVYVIKQLGTCEVYLATYAIKEYQARLFASLKADGLISSVHALLDVRNRVLDANAVQLMEENCTAIGYTRTHAKLTVIKGASLSVTIVTSANYTANTNNDVGIMVTEPTAAEYWTEWILKHIGNNGID